MRKQLTRKPTGLLSRLDAELAEAARDHDTTQKVARENPTNTMAAWESGYYQGRKNAFEYAIALVQQALLS